MFQNELIIYARYANKHQSLLHSFSCSIPACMFSFLLSFVQSFHRPKRSRSLVYFPAYPSHFLTSHQFSCRIRIMGLSVLHGTDFTHRPKQCGCSPALNTNKTSFNKLQTYCSMPSQRKMGNLPLQLKPLWTRSTVHSANTKIWCVSNKETLKKRKKPVFLILVMIETSAHLHKHDNSDVGAARKRYYWS